MKLFPTITAIYSSAVVGFAPMQTPCRNGNMKQSTATMISTYQNDFQSMTDIEHQIPLPPLYSKASPAHVKQKGDVMADLDFRWSSSLLTMAPALLMMYPCTW